MEVVIDFNTLISSYHDAFNGKVLGNEGQGRGRAFGLGYGISFWAGALFMMVYPLAAEIRGRKGMGY